MVLVYSCRIRNDFHPKKSIIRRIGSLFLVLAACNNVNLNMALFGFKMIPFIREIRNTFEIHLAKNSKPEIYSYLKYFQVFKILIPKLLPKALHNFTEMVRIVLDPFCSYRSVLISTWNKTDFQTHFSTILGCQSG